MYFSKYNISVTDLSCQQASFCSPVCFRRAARLQRQTVWSKQSPDEPPLSHSTPVAKQHNNIKVTKKKNTQPKDENSSNVYSCIIFKVKAPLLRAYSSIFRHNPPAVPLEDPSASSSKVLVSSFTLSSASLASLLPSSTTSVSHTMLESTGQSVTLDIGQVKKWKHGYYI